MEIKDIIKLKEAGFEPDEITKIKDKTNIKDFITLKNQGFSVDQMLELIPDPEPVSPVEMEKELEPVADEKEALLREVESLKALIQEQNRRGARQEEPEKKELSPEEALAQFYAPHLYNISENKEKEN